VDEVLGNHRFVDGGGWLPGAAAGGIFHDIVGYSTADPDHNEGRDKTPPGNLSITHNSGRCHYPFLKMAMLVAMIFCIRDLARA
jgi:hypothetical protein